MKTRPRPIPGALASVPSQRTPVRLLDPPTEYDVAIVGLGYVGLPTALEYQAAGRRVLALDVSTDRLDAIRSGSVDLVPADLARLNGALGDERFHLSTDVSLLGRARAVVICVPTPVDDHLLPDLGLLHRACAQVVAAATPGQLLMLTSTTYVGCTSDLLVEPLEARGLRVGSDIFVAFSAERIDPGNQAVEQVQVARVVGGATPECETRAVDLLGAYALEVHPVSSLATAEMTKLLENTFRAVNIALINEFADICGHLDVDVTEVIDAAATKPYGYMPFRPGPGVGGHCIPCDPHYLLWQLRGSRLQAPLVSEAMHQIAGRPRQVVDRMRDLLANDHRALAESRVLVVGVSYKPDVADIRESPALEILHLLGTAGATVAYVDPHVDQVVMPDGKVLRSVSEPKATEPHLVLLHTAHRDQDMDWLDEEQLVLDATYSATLGKRAVTL